MAYLLTPKINDLIPSVCIPLPEGSMLQDPQGMPEIACGPKPYGYYPFQVCVILMMNFNL